MKRILLLATVAALMAVVLVAMASAALAVPPASGETGCEGGLNNANHAVQQSSPSWDATSGDPSEAENPTQVGDRNRNSEPPGEDTATRDESPVGDTSAGNCAGD